MTIQIRSPKAPVLAMLGAGLLALGIPLVLSCGGGGGGGGGYMPPPPPPPPPPPTNTIQVGSGGFIFSPANLTVTAGTPVTWQWASSGHSVTSSDSSDCTANGGFDTGIQNAGYTFTHTYTTPGTYHFYCMPHCAAYGMKGTITVN